MVTWNFVNIGSSNDLLPDGINPLPELLLTNLSVKSFGNHLRGNFTWNAQDNYVQHEFENY